MTQNEAPLVSIITPVYNGERHLRMCIESVLAQTWTNWEYIIVNNRSSDGTLAIAEEYAARDRRIRVHTNDEFVRVIPNHNIALSRASDAAKYIKFVHADDMLFPECIERMVAVAEAHPTTGVIAAYRLTNTRVQLAGLEYPEVCFPGEEVARRSLLSEVWVFGSPTSTMLRAAAVRPLLPLYCDDNVHADTEACYRILRNWDFGYVHQVLTFTRRHEGAVTATVSPLNTYLGSHLSMLLKYGPCFLDPNEQARHYDRLMSRYYKYLARRAFDRPGKAFWRYHRKQLERLGAPLSYPRFLAHVARKSLNALTRPSIPINALRRRDSPRS